MISHITAFSVRTLAVCVACLLFHGCALESDSPDTPANDVVQLGFRIRLGDVYGSPASRSGIYASSLPSDYDDPAKYEDGVGFENYIGIDDRDFMFLIFDSDGRFVEKMSLLGAFPVGDELYPAEYTVLGTLSRKPDATFRIVALANWGVDNYPGDADLTPGYTTVADICENIAANRYEYPSGYMPSADTPIPMFGVKTHTVSSPDDRYIDIGDIYLLRALAKVEVVCSPESGLELASVTLSNYNSSGFCAPQGMYENTAYVSAPHIPADVVNTAETLSFLISEDKSRAVIYVPEYDNKGAAQPCRLSVSFADNTDRFYTVDFREYIGGKPVGATLDILRNCCYRFTVDKSAEFSVDLLPYGVVELEPGFGV